MTMLILAKAAGIAIGTDGDELAMLVPLKVPRDVRSWFENELYKYKAEVIDIIQRENGGGS
jgi:hypothetical protein